MRTAKVSSIRDEGKVMRVFRKHHGSAYRAWFSDSLITLGWKPVLKIKRNLTSWRLLRSPKGEIVDPFRGYRKSISYVVSKINKPGFYFVLNWGVIPTQGQLNRLRGIIERFSQQEKEMTLFRLKRLGIWFIWVGKKDTTAILIVKRSSIDKKYFEGIYEVDEESEFFVEVDVDIHNHSEDLDVSPEDKDYAKGADALNRFFTVTYQEGFAPFTSRGRVRDSKKRKIVIPWSQIRKEFRRKD